MNNLDFQFRKLEKDQAKLKTSRKIKIIKIRVGVNKIKIRGKKEKNQ